MHDLKAMPVYTPAPSGGMCRLLRRLRGGARLTVTRTAPNRLLCVIGGHEVPRSTVAGLIARGLLSEKGIDDATSEYGLTPDGERWAKDTDTTTNTGE